MRTARVAAVLFLILATGCAGGDGPTAPSGDLKACFSVNAPNGFLPGAEIIFDASCSESPFSQIETYTWDWNDGSDPLVTADPVVSHVFVTASEYDIGIELNTESGQSVSISKKVSISPIGSGEPPVALFSFTRPENWQPGAVINFNAADSYDPEGTPLSYNWDFGDGYVSGPLDQPEIEHTFTMEGDVYVTLTITDKSGLASVSEPVRLSFGYPLASPVDTYTDFFNITPISAFDISGDLFCTAGSDGLYVFDISDPENIILISQYFEEMRDLKDLSLSEGRVIFYTLAWKKRFFYLYDLTRPESPEPVSSFIYHNTSINDIILYGDYCYIAGYYGLNIIDFTDPENPQLHEVTTDEQLVNPYLDEDRLFVCYENIIRIYDLSDPVNPVQIGSITENFNVHDITVNGDTLFAVCGGADYLHIYDISDPSNPVLKTISGNILTVDMESTDEWLISAGQSRESVYLYRLVDRFYPHLGYRIALPYTCNHVLVNSDTAIAIGSNEFSVIDLDDIYGPLMASVTGTDVDKISGLFPFNNSLIVCGTPYAFMSFDTSNPALPVQVSSLKCSGDVTGATISGEHLYVTSIDGADSSLMVFDASEPGYPVLLNSLDYTGTEHNFNGIASSGNHLFINTEHALLETWDISSPENPSYMDALMFPGELYDLIDICTFESYVCLAIEETDSEAFFIYVIDVSTPEVPKITHCFPIRVSACAIFRDTLGRLVLVYHELYEDVPFQFADISSPGTMHKIAEVPGVEDAGDIQISGNYAYICDIYEGLTILDIGNLDDVMPVSSGKTTGKSLSVELYSNLAFVNAEKYLGQPLLNILKLW